MLSEVKDIEITFLRSFELKVKDLNDSAIFLFDTFENYLIFEKTLDIFHGSYKVKGKKFDFWKKLDIMIYCEDLTKEKISTSLPGEISQSILIEDNDEISLFSTEIFTENKCRVPQLIEINEFSRKTRKWATENFFSSMIENFHGCELVFKLSDTTKLPFLNYSVMIYEKSDEKVVVNPEGVLIDMIEALSKSLNFTIRYACYQTSTDEEAWFSYLY